LQIATLTRSSTLRKSGVTVEGQLRAHEVRFRKR
jgi:hypothetical protein